MDQTQVPPDEGLLSAVVESHARLFHTLEQVDDVVAQRPSRLPEWSIAHVLTHVARNADSFVRMLEAAADGDSVMQYPGGAPQREGEIETGARRPAAAIVNDVHSSAERLEAAFAHAPADAWGRDGLTVQGTAAPIRRLPFRRLREVEIHHVDLGLGYEVTDWPESFVAVTLPDLLAGVPSRVNDAAQRARLLAWVAGRADDPGPIELAPW